MTQEQQAGKRIVSKGEYVDTLMRIVFGEEAKSQADATPKRIVTYREYVQLQGKRIRLFGLATFCLTIGSLCIFLCLVSASILALGLYEKSTVGLFLLLFFLPATGISFFLKRGFAVASQVQRVDVVPLTRANTADLPAPDSLVRASAEPVQEQEAVLLRAATETTERHEEELLRASASRHE